MDFGSLIPSIITGIVTAVATVVSIRVELRWLRRDVDLLNKRVFPDTPFNPH